ncbi:MAG: AI-2E family transporter [Magnetococcales bacterium]|nr:AI-2E family transporter [Magnetococcales bacterium]
MESPEPSDTALPFEEGFLISLLTLAFIGLLWLFQPFLPGLFLALLLASSTYPLYLGLQKRLNISSDVAAISMTVLMFFLVISPVVYLLIATGVRLARAVAELKNWLSGFGSVEVLLVDLRDKMAHLPIPNELQEFLLEQAGAHAGDLGEKIAGILLFLFRGVTDNSLAFVSSLILITFALFFYYRDGAKIVERIKHLTPLANHLDDIILYRFEALATVLTLSTVSIALLQGLSLSLVTAFMGLPWFYLGVAIAVASFIPVVGGLIVWGPLAYWLYWKGEVGSAVFITFWGAVVIGFVVDNLVRPILIKKLSGMRSQSDTGGDLDVLSHTLLTVLATFGGLISFGILGLFFGPMIAAMAITIFDVYELKHGHHLDRS